MTAPNTDTITASIERSLQNCSLSNNHEDGALSGGGRERSSSSDEVDVLLSPEQNPVPNSDDTTLELNSHVFLPCHWEQCLDLKTGEIYYINWRNGVRAKEDPRITQDYNGDWYSEDDSSYDSEESSSQSSPSSTREHYRLEKEDQVLVVAGCKTCLMYFMVPKQVEDCPKCHGQLLHFDRSYNGFP